MFVIPISISYHALREVLVLREAVLESRHPAAGLSCAVADSATGSHCISFRLESCPSYLPCRPLPIMNKYKSVSLWGMCVTVHKAKKKDPRGSFFVFRVTTVNRYGDCCYPCDLDRQAYHRSHRLNPKGFCLNGPDRSPQNHCLRPDCIFHGLFHDGHVGRLQCSL